MSRTQKSGPILLLVLFFSLSGFAGGIPGEGLCGEAKRGGLFPQYEFQSPTGSDDMAYLGLPEKKKFTIGGIQADLIVLAVLNIYCVSCQMQAPVYNEVIGLLEKDPTTKGRTKWMGVGLGNNETEVAYFREEHGISFPILTDENFQFYNLVGGSGQVRTPMTILVQKDKEGRAIVVGSHVGFRGNTEEIFEGIKAALEYGLSYPEIKKTEEKEIPRREDSSSSGSDEELLHPAGEEVELAGDSITGSDEPKTGVFRQQYTNGSCTVVPN